MTDWLIGWLIDGHRSGKKMETKKKERDRPWGGRWVHVDFFL
jgi:hypothetical protein